VPLDTKLIDPAVIGPNTNPQSLSALA